MGREIKFRGVNKLTNEWEYRDLLQAKSQRQAWIINRLSNQIILETAGEYTGVHDNTDEETEVFEGDVIVFNYKDVEYTGEVKFEAGMFIIACINLTDSYIPMFDIMERDRDFWWINGEVIGNKFENINMLGV